MIENTSIPDGFDQFLKLTNASHRIYLVWTIIFMIIGFVGNILALMIFIRWANRLSIYIYFSFLCIINILILVIDMNYHFLIPYIIDSKLMVEKLLPVSCKFIFFFTYFFRYIFIWLITIINVDRCLYLTENRWKNIFCQQRSALIICSVLIVLSIIANVHFLIYFNQPIINEVPSPNTCTLDGLLCHCKATHRTYRMFWKRVWPIYNLIIFAVIPFFIMVICCILIIRNIHVTRNNVYGVRRNSDTSIKSNNDNLRSITKTLIYLDLLFPLTIFPILFLQTYINYNTPKKCSQTGILNLIFALGFSLMYVKNTFAFFIYYFTGRKFRLAVSNLIRCRNFSGYTESH